MLVKRDILDENEDVSAVAAGSLERRCGEPNGPRLRSGRDLLFQLTDGARRQDAVEEEAHTVLLARGDEIPKEYHETIKKGLTWLAKQQHKDGHFEGMNGQYAPSMTAMAGMALLCEGSTVREGKYRDNIRRARDWLMDRTQRNGLIGNAASATEGGRYMYGHGFGMLFLSCVVGEEENADKRRKLEEQESRREIDESREGAPEP